MLEYSFNIQPHCIPQNHFHRFFLSLSLSLSLSPLSLFSSLSLSHTHTQFVDYSTRIVEGGKQRITKRKKKRTRRTRKECTALWRGTRASVRQQTAHTDVQGSKVRGQGLGGGGGHRGAGRNPSTHLQLLSERGGVGPRPGRAPDTAAPPPRLRQPV